jgi:hypothetical protein
MSGTVVRAIIAFVFAFHGVGHAMGIIPALGIVKVGESSQSWLKNWSSHSWLLTGVLGDGASRVVCVVLYLAGLVGFIGAALAVLGWGVPHNWWRTLALVSAVVSLLALILYWNALIFLFPHKVGALAVNVATIVCLLALNWPAEADLGF